MPDRADNTWAEMVRQHAEFADSQASPDGMPVHRPHAAILACSDARVPPSLLFGQEQGSLFSVRLAGNSATPGAIASLTYAVEALGTDLIVVLGHTGCGAVGAALEAGDDPLTQTLSPILTPIDEMLAACDTCNSHDAAVAANVRHNVDRLTRDRGPLGQAIRAGRVSVRGAVHDLATGHLIDVATRDAVQPPSTPRPSNPDTNDLLRSAS